MAASALLSSTPLDRPNSVLVPSPTRDPRFRVPITSDSPTLTPGSFPIVDQPKITQKPAPNRNNARPNRDSHSDDPAAHKSTLLQTRPNPITPEQDSHPTQASNLKHSNNSKQKDQIDRDPKQVSEIGLTSSQNSKAPSPAFVSSTHPNALTDGLTSASADLDGLIPGRLGRESASDESDTTVTIIAGQATTAALISIALAGAIMTPEALNKTTDGIPESPKTAFAVSFSRTILPLTTGKSPELGRLTTGGFGAGETFGGFLSSCTIARNSSKRTGNNTSISVKVFQGEADDWKVDLSWTKEVVFMVTMIVLNYV